MTTIAYRDGVIAADSGSWIGSAAVTGVRKVVQSVCGALVGASGNAAEVCEFLSEVSRIGVAGARKPRSVDGEDSSFIALIYRPKMRTLRLLTCQGEENLDGLPYMAIGGGSEAALGAMHAGATAQQAIEAAIAHTDCARAPVSFVEAK